MKKTYLFAILAAGALSIGNFGVISVFAAEAAEHEILLDNNEEKQGDDEVTEYVVETNSESSLGDPTDNEPLQHFTDETEEDDVTENEQSVLETVVPESVSSEEVTEAFSGQDAFSAEEPIVEETYNERDTILTTAFINESQKASPISGSWKQQNGRWYYFGGDGNVLKGIVTIDSITYLLDTDTGAMKINQWYQVGRGWYHSDGYGRVQTGWQRYGSSWYYLDPENNGAMVQNRFVSDENGKHYVDGYGIMQINRILSAFGDLYAVNGYGIVQIEKWCQIGGKWYYADEEGILKTGIQSIGKLVYLLDSDSGAMKINQWYQIGSNWYHSDGYGRVQTGWQRYGSSWYYLDPDQQGAMAKKQFISDGNGLHYVDGYGIMQVNKILNLDGKTYITNGYGIIQKNGWSQFSGKWYYTDSDSILKTGIQTINGIKYLLDSETGAMKINQWYQIGSNWYHSDGYGRLQTGWQQYGSDWYYLDPDKDGAMAKGLITIGDTSYYLNGYGIMQKYTIVTVNGKSYMIDGYGIATDRSTMPLGKYRQEIVALAQSLVGIREGSSAHHRIVDVYNTSDPLPRGYTVKYSDSWCAVFTSYLAIDCGYTSIIPVECGCPQWITQAKEMGSWEETDSYIPTPGDFILYDWQDSGSGNNTGTPDHIGVVEKVAGGIMSIIEGNYQDMVKRREIAVNGTYIRGFVVPHYSK